MYNLDFVLVDLGPSIDEITKAFVCSCDFMLPPAFPDFFSASSAHGLLNDVLPEWLRWRGEHRRAWSTLSERDRKDLTDHGYYDFGRPLKILPFLVQNYTLLGDGAAGQRPAARRGRGREISPSSSDFIYSITTLAREARDDEVRALYAPDGDGRMVVPFCRKLTAAPTVSQNLGVPMVCLTEEHLGRGMPGRRRSGRTPDAMQERAEFAEEVGLARASFGALACFLVELDRHRRQGPAG